jgi:O-methyltransferase
MDNVFITQYFDWNRPPSRKVRWVNSLLSAMRFKARLVPPHATGEQTSLEQRISLYHLAGEVLHCRVPGDFVEIGTHKGSTAALLQRVIEEQDPTRRLNVYDAFLDASTEELLMNFRALQLEPPVIHAGLFQDTLPATLPEQIAFAHVDVGWRQPSAEQRDTINQCLTDLYPRLAPGAICVVADYCQSDVFSKQGFTPPTEAAQSEHWDQYPAIRLACDAFFAGKPETMTMLYGGPYSHGFFRRHSSSKS